MEPVFNLADTRIEQAGVMRCCLETVGAEYDTKPVSIGMKSKCQYCDQPFTLVESKPHPIWKPDWQIQEETMSQ